MKVALTGATGFIGSHVLAELQQHGHEVTALVPTTPGRSVAASGATPVVVDLYDRPAVVSALGDADGASTRPSRRRDQRRPGLGGGRCGDRGIRRHRQALPPHHRRVGLRDQPAISEESPFDPPAMVAWKEPIAPRARCERHAGSRDRPGVAYGDGGGGVPGLLLGSPRDDAGNLIMLGTGRQHWPTVHVADLADVFRRAWKTTRPAATTSSATDRTRPSPSSPRRRPSPPALRARSRVPTTRRGPAWATTSPRSSCSIRARRGRARAELGGRHPSGTRRRVPPRQLPQSQ